MFQGRCGHFFNWTAPQLRKPTLPTGFVVNIFAEETQTIDPVTEYDDHICESTVGMKDNELTALVPLQSQVDQQILGEVEFT